MKSVGSAILAYVVIAIIAFGDIFKPLAFATQWSDRLGAPYWPALVAGSLAVAGLVFLLPARFTFRKWLKLPIFVAAVMILSVLSVGFYADSLRREKLARFPAQERFEHSFFRSLREAPREFQFFLHAAVLKDCVPFAWSYARMDLYRVPPGAAINVLPGEWIKRCPFPKADHSPRQG